MRARARAALVLVVLTVALAGAAPADDVLWRDNDARPVAEPEYDEEADFVWWDGIWAMSVYQLHRVLDLGHAARAVGAAVGLAPAREAANVNALDEVPDSTWFTNRHGLHRLSRAALARGPQRDNAPAGDGPLVILSGKSQGMTPGFVVRDAKGDRYLVKLDPPHRPDLPTGAEMVCSKILWALGWNVPEYYLARIDPARFEIDDEAWIEDRYERRRRFTRERLEAMLTRAGMGDDGRLRVVASLFIDGEAKGGFRTLGLRADDANDTVPHQHRRDLRGLRVVAAWLNFTDARRGNFYDAFVVDEEETGRGHLVHYLLDFSSGLGAGNHDWKERWYGQEYFLGTGKNVRFLTFGFFEPSWEDVALAHPAIGYLDAEHFEPESWRTTYPNPLFDHATLRDEFWGAKLVTSFDDDDIAAVVATGEWSEPSAADVLARILRERRQKIAEVYFDAHRVNPADRFAIDGERPRERLRWLDRAVASGVADAASARYRFRGSERDWRETTEPVASVAPLGAEIEMQTSHDRGEHWSPPTRVTLERGSAGRLQVVAIDRESW